LHREIPQVYRDTLELDIQGAMSSRKFTVARDLLLQVQTLNIVRRAVTGTLTCGDYIYKLRQGGSKAVDLLISVSTIRKFLFTVVRIVVLEYHMLPKKT
jgi:integrator complex subunit 8